MNKVLAIVAAFLAALAGSAAFSARAADPYPVKPVRIIVASGPGSGDDFATRPLSELVEEVCRLMDVNPDWADYDDEPFAEVAGPHPPPVCDPASSGEAAARRAP